MRRDSHYLRSLVLGSHEKNSELSSRSIYIRRRKKLRIDELYAMHLAKKHYNQLTKLDKEIAREELARKVLKYYFNNWGTGYVKLLNELDDFYDKFPRAGRDKVTFVRFIRSLGVTELKRVFNSEPDILFSAQLWLRRYQGKVNRLKDATFGEFYAKVANAVAQLQKDKWARKLVNAVINLAKKTEKITNGMGRKELGFYDYYAVYIMRKCNVAVATAFTAAILTTRHVIAEYYFDVSINYKQRLLKIREHFKYLFEEYPSAEALLDDYFIRSVIEAFSWEDIIRFTGADIEKVERYYRKNKHKFSAKTSVKLLQAINNFHTLDFEKKKQYWREHRLALSSLTALAEISV